MPFSRPTLQQLIDRAASDIESRLPGTDARLRRSLLNILARMHAGAMHGLYGYHEWLAKQLMVDTSEAEYLDRHASIWQITRKAAAASVGNITATGTNGVTVPAGTALQRSDGAEYTTDADATIASGTATIAVTASVGGTAGDTAAASTLSFISPIAGVNSSATVAVGGLTGGADIETDDSLRSRLLERLRRPPNAGTKEDYEAWALEVAGVTRAWCNPLELGLGTAVVRFVRDDDVSLIPDAGEVAAVQAYIDARRPIGAAITVSAPTAVALNISITLTPNTAAVRDAVTAELTDLLRREAAPGGTILLSHIREAISTAAGETNSVVTAPTGDVTHTTSQIATLGTVTFA